MNEIIELRIDQLKPGDNPREIDFKNDEDMETLLSTMEKVGYEGIDPILVYKTEFVGTYEIDDGHRRFHCACQMEWKKLRAIEVLRPRTEADRFFKRGLRNLNQKKLTNGELVRFVGRLHTDFSWTQDQIAKDTKLSQSYVSQLCIIHNYPLLLEYIDNNGQIMIAVQLARIDDVTVMQSLIEQGCTVDSVKQYRESIKPKEKEEDAEKPKETTLEEEKQDSEEEEAEGEEEEGEDEDKEEPKGEGSDSSGGSLPGEEGGSTEPETPPPEPKSDGWKKGHYHPCGTFFEDGSEHIVKKRNDHTCKDVLSVALNVNHKILPLIERKETVDVKNGSTLRTDWHINDSYGPFQVDNGRLEEAIEKWNENKRATGLVVRALENVKQKRDNDEIERLKNLEKEPLIVVS